MKRIITSISLCVLFAVITISAEAKSPKAEPAPTAEGRMPGFAEALQDHGCENVKIEVIKNSVHYVVGEQPKAVAHLIERYACCDR